VNASAADATWTTVSGSLPPDVGSGGYAELATTGRVVLDSRLVGEATPAIVKVNAVEAETLTGVQVDSAATALEAARTLASMHGGAAIVTRGIEGVVAVDPDGRDLEGTLAAVGPYPVGSGDAFLAGLVVALERNETWERALACALGAGAANAFAPGAGCLERVRAKELALDAVVRVIAG
jgi:fructose-1-phosphate kinase PfkB-like protein